MSGITEAEIRANWKALREGRAKGPWNSLVVMAQVNSFGKEGDMAMKIAPFAFRRNILHFVRVCVWCMGIEEQEVGTWYKPPTEPPAAE